MKLWGLIRLLGVAFDHVAGSLEMHFTPLMHGCNQVHVDAATILSEPMVFLRLIDDYVNPSILPFDSQVLIGSPCLL